MAENGQELPILNLEKLSEILSFYRLPLILASIGILLTVISLIVLVVPSSKDKGIEFFTEATVSGKNKIRVDVVGMVYKPGVYEFDEGDRVEDAIQSAGGITDQADSAWIEKNMNRAAKLADGGKIFIPSTKDSVSNNLLGVTTEVVNINSASQAELEALPGIGPVTAEKIISGRPYQTIEELKTKKSLGEALFDKIKDKITI